jgi:aspartokinase
MAILSLVGAQMKDMVGVAGKMFTTLGEHGVNLEMISQGRLSPEIGQKQKTELTFVNRRQ